MDNLLMVKSQEKEVYNGIMDQNMKVILIKTVLMDEELIHGLMDANTLVIGKTT